MARPSRGIERQRRRNRASGYADSTSKQRAQRVCGQNAMSKSPNRFDTFQSRISGLTRVGCCLIPAIVNGSEVTRALITFLFIG